MLLDAEPSTKGKRGREIWYIMGNSGSFVKFSIGKIGVPCEGSSVYDTRVQLF